MFNIAKGSFTNTPYIKIMNKTEIERLTISFGIGLIILFFLIQIV